MKIYKLLNYTLATAVAAVLVASCSDESDVVNHGRQVEARFTTNLSSGWLATRVSDNTWNAGDKVGVAAVAKDGGLTTESVFGQYNVEADGTPADLEPVGEPVYFPANGDEVSFIAFYPYKQPVDNKVTYNAFAEQGTQADMAQSDYLYSYDKDNAYNQDTPEVGLNFAHKLSQLTIYFTTANGSTSVDRSTIDEVSLSQLPGEIEVDLATGNYTLASGSPVTTKMCYTIFGSFHTAKAIVVPHTSNGTAYTNRTLTVKMKDGDSYTYVFPNDYDFESGKSHGIEFELTTNGLRLNNRFSTNWDEDDFTTWAGSYIIKSAQSVLSLNYEARDNYELTFKTNYGGDDATVKYSDSATDANAGITGDWLKEATPASKGSDAFTYALAVTENIDAVTRTGYIHITVGVPGSGITTTQVITVKQKGLSNCYIVKPGESVEIPYARANAFAQLISGSDVIVEGANPAITPLWWDTEDLITFGAAGNGKFIVNAASGKTGNAVVAVLVDLKVVWSWHIWVTDYAPDPATDTWMNRNLGAITNQKGVDGSTGLYYQWGRKDPFPGSTTATSATEPTIYVPAYPNGMTYAIRTDADQHDMAWTVANPQTFIGYDGSWMLDSTESDTNWNSTDNRKTLFDPCPEGYRVPLNSSWGADADWSGFAWDDTNKGYDTGSAYGGWYPAAGARRFNDGTINGAGSYGYYWFSLTKYTISSHYLYLSSLEGVYTQLSNRRSYGFSVRCMAESD